VGEPAPQLSLTADEGTWIRTRDFKDHIHAVLIFFRSLTDDATDQWLKEFQRRRARFEELETGVFGVHTARTDRLREYRASLGLDYFLLYDPLAIDSRAFRSSSRWRPITKDGVVVIAKDGTVAYAAHGRPDPQDVLVTVARLQGVELKEEGPAPSARADSFSNVRKPGQRADEVHHIDSAGAVRLLSKQTSHYILVDVRTLSEFEADHAPRAIHIPVDELPHRYQELGQTTHIICICQAGGRSAAAAEFLTSVGCSEVYSVEGGMTSWSGERVTGGLSQQ
jgi:rhodanese-related sulfurtransferase/peroxiredoxin